MTKKKTTEEPVVNPDVIVSSGKLDKKQGFAQNKKLRIAGYMLLAVLVVVGIGWLVKDNFHQTVITIGDTKITKKDITDYAAGLEKYQKDHPGSKFSDNLDQFALDKLILHAGLVNEAKKYNITLNDDDLLRSAGQQISDLQQKKQFLADIKAPGSKLIRYNLENQAYQAKLSDKLIAKKKLLALNLTLASPYFEDLPQAKVQAAYDTAKKRLQNDFLSQMNSGASTDSIIAKADTSWNQSPTSSDQTNTGNDAAKEMGMYFSESVVAAEVMDNYTKGSIQFTDPKDKSWVRGNIGKLYNPADKIESLKKVGTNTGIFASTNGAFMVIRLDGLSGGSYASWDDFLTHYKNQYVQGKLGTLANATGKYLNDSTQKAIDALTSIGIAKASAATDKVCNSNQYDVTVEGIDMWSGALVSGAKLDIYRDPNATYHRTDTASDGTVHDEYYTAANTCGAAGHNYAISGSSFTPNLDNWSRSGENFLDQTFNDSCWNVPPVFYVAAQANPSNWSPSNRSITNTNAVWANFPYNPAKASLASNGYGYDARDGSSGNGDVYEGFPNPPNGPALGGQPIEWYDNYDSPTNPSHLNAWHLKPGLANTRHYFVMLRYYPKWNRSGTSSVTPATASPGQKVTFKHKVGGTGAIDYLDGSTPPNGSASMTRPTATLERKVPGGS